MAKLKHTNPDTGEQEVVEIDIPPGMEKDQKFLEDTLRKHYAANPDVEKSRRANMQGMKGPMDLSKPVTYGSNQPDNIPDATGIRKTLLGGAQTPQPTDIPVLSSMKDTVSRAVNAPISGQSWDNKTADIIEGAGTVLGAGMLPEMAGNPIKALTSLLPAYGASKAVEGVTNNRLAGDIAGGMAGSAEFSSPKIRAGTQGALKGGLDSIFDMGAKYHGIPVPPVVAGGALGKIAGSAIPGGGEVGMIAGASLPVIKGAYQGAVDASADQPWFGSPVAAKDRPLYSEPNPAKMPPRAPSLPVEKPSFGPGVEPNPAKPVRPIKSTPAEEPALGPGRAPHPVKAPKSITTPEQAPAYGPGKEPDPVKAPPKAPKTTESETDYTKPRAPNPSRPVKPIKVKDTPNEPTSKTTEETKSSSSESTKSESKGSESKEEQETKTTSSKDVEEKQGINPIMDKVLSHADPSWDGQSQVNYPHIVKVADAVGIKPNQVRSMLTELGYSVSPSKFPERINKGENKDIPWDKLTTALRNLSKD